MRLLVHCHVEMERKCHTSKNSASEEEHHRVIEFRKWSLCWDLGRNAFVLFLGDRKPEMLMFTGTNSLFLPRRSLLPFHVFCFRFSVCFCLLCHMPLFLPCLCPCTIIGLLSIVLTCYLLALPFALKVLSL